MNRLSAARKKHLNSKSNRRKCVFEPLEDRNLLAAVKVFLLAGHSNVLGAGRIENLDPAWNVPQEDVWIWLDHNIDGVGDWVTLEPGHGGPTHGPHPGDPEGITPGNDGHLKVGPELSLGRTLADAYPEHRIALIKHGSGGGTIGSDWNPENVGPPESRDHMWSGLLKKASDAFAALDAAGHTYEVEGFFWALGGGDARNWTLPESSDPAEIAVGEQEALEHSAAYGANLTRLIDAARNEFSADLPFAMLQITDEYTPGLRTAYPGVELIRQGHVNVAASTPGTNHFSPAGLTLLDAIHYDAMGQVELGRRFANSYLDLVAAPDAPETFHVGSFRPTSTGFEAAFSAELDASTLNVYDSMSAAVGLPDVIVEGEASGIVSGSLVVDPLGRGITFVNSGGPLGADEYTVTLISGDGAFKNTDGDLVDGNQDGIAGDDFATTFTVTNHESVVVSIPDFVRGPGQPVHLPADATTGIPVTLSDAAGVRIAVVALGYDPTVLEITAANVGAGMPPGVSVALDSSTAGTAIVTLTSPEELPAGSGVVLNLQARVPTTGASLNYGRQQVLDVHSVVLSDANGDPISVMADDAVHLVS